MYPQLTGCTRLYQKLSGSNQRCGGRLGVKHSPKPYFFNENGLLVVPRGKGHVSGALEAQDGKIGRDVRCGTC